LTVLKNSQTDTRKHQEGRKEVAINEKEYGKIEGIIDILSINL
jgi:hypothetical protein